LNWLWAISFDGDPPLSRVYSWGEENEELNKGLKNHFECLGVGVGKIGDGGKKRLQKRRDWNFEMYWKEIKKNRTVALRQNN